MATCPICRQETDVPAAGRQMCSACGGELDVRVDLRGATFRRRGPDPLPSPSLPPNPSDGAFETLPPLATGGLPAVGTAATPAACAQHPAAEAPFRCDVCGAAICGVCCIRVEERTACPACYDTGFVVPRFRLPWLDRKQDGLIGSYLATAKLLCLEPSRAAQSLPLQPRPGDALLFAAAGGLASGVVASLFGAVITTFVSTVIPATTRGGIPPGRAAIAIGVQTLGNLVGYPLLVIVGTVVLGALYHAVAYVCGGRAPFARSIECAGYVQVVSVVGWIPCVGWLALLVVPFYLFRSAHGLGTGGALLVSVAPLFLCCGLYLGGVAAVALL